MKEAASKTKRITGIEAIVFDWDGCLIDSFEVSYKAYQRAFLSVGLRLDREFFKKHYGPDWYSFYERAGIPKRRWKMVDKLWLSFYEQLKPTLRSGVRRLLDVLSKDYTVALVTGGSRMRVMKEIDNLCLTDFFRTIVCSDDTSKKKPTAEPLRLALRRMDIPASKAVYVGDTCEDVLMGKTVGCTTVAVESQFTSARKILKAKPDLIIRRPAELLKLLSTENSLPANSQWPGLMSRPNIRSAIQE